MDPLQVVIEPLGQAHDRGAFECGERFIDGFLQKRSLEAHDLYKARVYVATQPESATVIGFYTLSLTALKPQDTTPAEAEAKFGTWAIPFVYLGQIGVHKDYQNGRGVGSALMYHAFERTLEIADLAGTYGLMLDAINEEKAQWYERLEFQRFDTEEDGRIKMHVPLTTIRSALL